MDKLLNWLKALSNAKRLQIIQLLKECDSCCVSDLAEKLGCDQPAVSHDLAILRKAGLVLTRREGRHIHYSLDKVSFEELKETLF